MHQAHRRRFFELLRREGAAAILPTASHKVRNHDCHYRFRPDSDFWYLTGFREPDAALVLLPARTSAESDRSILFLRPRDKEREIWEGRRLGLEAAPEQLGVSEARAIENLWSNLPKLLAGYEHILFRAGSEGEQDRKMLELLRDLRARARGNILPPQAVLDPAGLLHELRLFKDEEELAHMRRAAEISAAAHRAAMAKCRPGAFEHEIEALIESTFRKRGSTGPAYTSIVAGGANACILHYIENECELQDGQLLLVDAGAEWEYYASDVTRTFPINGRFNPEQRAVYEVVLRAQKAAMETVRPGAAFDAPHQAALAVLVEGLLDLGLLQGTSTKVIEEASYRRFYMHRTSHYLGLDVHDCGAYSKAGSARLLEPGMVLTIEPGLYLAADDETIAERWRGIGVRIEDDLLVTADGYENLTVAIPKEVEAVEEACHATVPVALM